MDTDELIKQRYGSSIGVLLEAQVFPAFYVLLHIVSKGAFKTSLSHKTHLPPVHKMIEVLQGPEWRTSAASRNQSVNNTLYFSLSYDLKFLR